MEEALALLVFPLFPLPDYVFLQDTAGDEGATAERIGELLEMVGRWTSAHLVAEESGQLAAGAARSSRIPSRRFARSARRQ